MDKSGTGCVKRIINTTCVKAAISWIWNKMLL